MHATLQIGGSVFMLGQECAEMPEMKSAETAGNVTCFSLERLRSRHGRVVQAGRSAAGAKAADQPKDAFWGDRYGRVIDPFGYTWGHPHAPEGPHARRDEESRPTRRSARWPARSKRKTFAGAAGRTAARHCYTGRLAHPSAPRTRSPYFRPAALDIEHEEYAIIGWNDACAVAVERYAYPRLGRRSTPKPIHEPRRQRSAS